MSPDLLNFVAQQVDVALREYLVQAAESDLSLDYRSGVDDARQVVAERLHALLAVTP